VTGVQGDVSNLGDLDRLFAQIKREKGKLDVVFANAGVAKYAPFGNKRTARRANPSMSYFYDETRQE
jgi:NAD(P)-dependent dehydrogenase (short-subunit alcohol dehydrogenase family)